MAQNTEYFGLYRNGQLRRDIKPTFIPGIEPSSMTVSQTKYSKRIEV